MKNGSMLEFGKINASNEAALKFLCDRFEARRAIRCPACRSKRRWINTRSRLRCMNCRLDYRPFEDTWLGEISIGFQKWITLIKAFEIGLSARKASEESAVSYPTAHAAFEIMRESILENVPWTAKKIRGTVEADESYFGGKRKGKRGRGAAGKKIVFGVKEKGGRVIVDVVKNVKQGTLTKSMLKKVEGGSMVYTDKWKGYDALFFAGYRHRSVDHGKRFKQGAVHINGIEGFWAFAKEAMIKYHGVDPGKFPLYIKEMEWRYNNQNKDKFLMLIDYMLII